MAFNRYTISTFPEDVFQLSEQCSPPIFSFQPFEKGITINRLTKEKEERDLQNYIELQSKANE